MDYTIVSSLLLDVVFTLLIFKNKKLKGIKVFLYKLFGTGSLVEDKHNYKFGYKFLKIVAYFFMYLYVIFIGYLLFISIITLNTELAIPTLALIIIYPVLCRFIIGFQKFIYGIK